MEGLLTDNGGEFNNDELRDIASVLNVRVLTTAGYSPFQNGTCERIHAVTDAMLTKLQEQYPKTSLDILLSWANMARNSLQMWHGYSSYQLVFGKNPNLPNIMNDNLPALEGTTMSENLAKHLNILHASRKAFVECESDERIRRALRHKIRASEVILNNGDLVYYKRENRAKWLGPGKVVFQDGKIVFVRHGGVFVRVSPNRIIKADEQFSDKCETDNLRETSSDEQHAQKQHTINEHPNEQICEILGERMPDINDTPAENVTAPPIAHLESADEPVPGVNNENFEQSGSKNPNPWLIQLNTGDKIKYKTVNDEWSTATIISRAGKSKGSSNRWYNVRDESTKNELSVKLDFKSAWFPLNDNEVVNIVTIPKHKQNDDGCLEAKKAELSKLKHFDTYEEVVDTGQNTISTTWVLWKKGDNIRARLVARGFEENIDLQKESPTVNKHTVRVFLAIAATKKWTVKTTDIKSAFLQSKNIEREVYIKPPKEAECANRIWKLKRCLYGLNDAARQFFDSVSNELKAIGCVQSDLDPALFFMKQNGHIIGMLVSHIDDFLHAGEAAFDDLVMDKLCVRFLAGKFEKDHFHYIGFSVSTVENALILDQEEYLTNIDLSDISVRKNAKQSDSLSEKELTELRSVTGKLNWLVQGTRPDMIFDMIELSMAFKKGTIENLRRAIKSIRKARNEPCKICFPILGNEHCWKIHVFTDAALANLCDGVSSMGAQIVFLVGENDRCCPIAWQGGKIKRVVKSTIAAEALSLLEGLELSVYLKSLLSSLTTSECKCEIHAFVDNKSVVESVYSSKLIDDKRLRLDICAIKNYIKDSEICTVSWCPGKSQIANVMTKKGASSAQLLHVLQTGVMEIELD